MLTRKNILGSLQYVVDNSTYVSINHDTLDNLVKTFTPKETVHWYRTYPLKYEPRASVQDEIDFVFLTGNQAFCYWRYPNKWTIDIAGIKLDGFYANVAAFDRALKNGVPLLDGNFLANMTLAELRAVYDGEPEIPLLAERRKMLKSIGETLVTNYDGRFHNFFEENKQSALDLVEKIAAEFAGFNDVANYKGHQVLFYKKAQLVVTDLNKTAGKINQIEELPGFADYKIPAILRTKGVLQYQNDLARKVDNRIEIPAGSEMEIEIRAGMLWACKEIVDKLAKRGIEITAVDFENILWIESQDKTKLDKPYHLTRTIFY